MYSRVILGGFFKQTFRFFAAQRARERRPHLRLPRNFTVFRGEKPCFSVPF